MNVSELPPMSPKNGRVSNVGGGEVFFETRSPSCSQSTFVLEKYMNSYVRQWSIINSNIIDVFIGFSSIIVGSDSQSQVIDEGMIGLRTKVFTKDA